MANVPAHGTILSSRAQKEITEAWNWYEDRQPGLGDHFLKEVSARIEKIEQLLKDTQRDLDPIKKHRFRFSHFLSSTELIKGKNSFELFQYFTLL
jgi:uncharacterized protein (DUF2235 family)